MIMQKENTEKDKLPEMLNELKEWHNQSIQDRKRNTQFRKQTFLKRK